MMAGIGNFWQAVSRDTRRRWWLLNQPWMRVLADCQEEVAVAGGNAYYRRMYGPQELYYWHHIAAWLYQDSRSVGFGKVLDIGCAYGTLAVYTKLLCNCQVYATDIADKTFSTELRKRYSIEFAVNNCELEPLPWDRQFDAIIFTEVLEHFNFNPVPTMQKLRSAVSPHGRLYLSTPDAVDWGRLDHYASYRDMPEAYPDGRLIDDHIYQFNFGEVVELAESTGFRIERAAYAIGIGRRHLNLTLVPV